jgi:NADP-dependent 3-hydroxy acid dehydrogenase YdfG
MSNIQDKVVIITGASSGIGEATVKELANEFGDYFPTLEIEERLK